MIRQTEPFSPANGKRQILIAEDEPINRDLLGMMLEEEYDLLYACDGLEAMERIRENGKTLSLILLDILMPGMSGFDVLRALREDERYSRIPVIVMTAERETEVESLRLGATDFIPKPYPEAGIIRARVSRTIELFEDQETIRSTERDELTGLYSREYFFRYAEQIDQYGGNSEMDAVVVDINHFHLLNERYGRHYGDEVLRRIGNRIREITEESGGIACRAEADTFLAYCPARSDYADLLQNSFAHMMDENSAENRVRIRMGVYAHADRTIDIERRFDRAKMAADTVKGSFFETVGFYDDSLHRQQLYAEQLIEDFPAAVSDGQFHVYYQPKFDVRPETPVLASAEALVRWIHPKLGMISPRDFIPLFEENGLIQRLDRHVWRETARQIRDWKDRFGYSVPVSVNVSRIDLYDPGLPEILRAILEEYGLSGEDLLLEITESAYTQDSGQIIDTVKQLRGMGFRVEMDDFGTGYSSLNMISRLPVDALKLDIQFVRSAFQEGGTTRMLEIIIGIADFLKVPVIAEGVETEEQLHTLRAIGCDIVQGYFFSRPVKASEYEPFILQRKESDLASAAGRETASSPEPGIRDTLREAVQSAGEAQQASAEEPEKTEEKPAGVNSGIRLGTASVLFAVLALIAAAALLIADIAVSRGYQRMEQASDRYIAAQSAASEMESASDYLTDRVRCFVVTGDAEYMEDFFEEVEKTRRRDRAVEDLEELLAGGDTEALSSLNAALNLSNELVGIENTAMRLMVEAGSYPASEVPEALQAVSLSPEQLAMSPEKQKETAQGLVFDQNYMHYKDRIRGNVGQCTQALIRSSSQALEQASERLAVLVNIHSMLSVLLLLIVLVTVWMIFRMILKPLAGMVRGMQDQELVSPAGAEELRFVSRTYNSILLENRAAQERLSHAASHDALTGLFNRGAYDLLMESADKDHMALILIDVDSFKSINDTFGHAVGDQVLRRVAELLKGSFRSVDILCRTGGDEFAVVMTRVNSSMRQLVLDKIGRINDQLQHPKDGLPPVSLSAGAAFSDRQNPQGDLFTDADTALYRVKKAGRMGCEIYE